MKIFNIGITEDNAVEIFNGDIKEFDYNVCISFKNEMCTKLDLSNMLVCYNMTQLALSCYNMLETYYLNNVTAIEDENSPEFKYYQLLLHSLNQLKKIVDSNPNCVVLDWAVEYDQNICVIYDSTSKEINNYLTR